LNNSIELLYTFKKIINQKNITENSKYNNEKIKVSNIVEGAFKNNFKSGTKTAVKRNRNIELFSKVLYLNSNNVEDNSNLLHKKRKKNQINKM